MPKDIELELRAEVSDGDIDSMVSDLQKEYDLQSHTNRLMVMLLGEADAGALDVRVRITNGDAEVVIKKGCFHTDDRKEVEQSISTDQFMGFVRQFRLFEFDTEVAERETYNFATGDDITFSVVTAGDIAYVEIEKMTNEKSIEEDRSELYEIAESFDLNVIESEQVFDDLCDRLSKSCDWQFTGTDEDYERLQEQLEEYR
jgi:hypothetical protein